MKNIEYTEPFERLWESEVEAEGTFNNKLFCITFLICNPASCIGFYLSGDPFFFTLLVTHFISSSIILVLLVLNHNKLISGQRMSFYTQLLLIGFYAYLLSQPHMSYAQSCLNLTLGVIFAGLILRWPVRYALICSALSITLYPLAIYTGATTSLKTFFEDGGIFLLMAHVLFPLVMKLSMAKDKREYYYRYNLEQKNEDLERQKTIAEKAMRAKSDFLSIMSHEIRTPLNGIVGIVHIMTEDGGKGENQQELLQTLKFSSDHLMGVVNDVLDFNKINSNHVQLDPVPFDPTLLFENLRKTFVPRADEKGLALIFDIDNKLPARITGDMIRLNQILTNLIHNAIKFTAKGHVKLVVREKGRSNEKVQLHFAVEDTGIGIATEEQQGVFEIFTQVKPKVQQENTGTGLGLAISKELLRLFGSEMNLKSEAGKGAEFSFDISLAYSEDAVVLQPAETQIVTAVAYPQTKVLVADDNKTNLTVATMLLKRRDILFETASNGQEAYEKFADGGFNLVLMDLRMPVLNGFEATALIRQVDKKIPIIALTASAFEDEKERAMSSGFTGYLTKPFIPEDFYNYIFPFLGVQTAKVHS
ncbi:response regulator [Dyadobacter sp. CY326]|uniref:response regulator n=1 Tax=Dyadobacter sp. CY326 TaxID=2907300 RepID=UPI001F2A96F9|nr:response regulator [Dyadobacter sp. CY326]MCE7064208.1 ATP-binding protein [Dyadobacter sp. CY326]